MPKLASAVDLPHKMPADLEKALKSDSSALERWEDLTPLAQNEWICWCISVKKQETRNEHVNRTVEELLAGKRRPCCWMGCLHRSDRKIPEYLKDKVI